jgi:putative hemolysin
MAAYAYLYANPDYGRISELVDAVIVEGTRFGRYWGLRALGQQLQARPSALDAATRCRLEHFATTLDTDTDAADELRQLLGRSPA